VITGVFCVERLIVGFSEIQNQAASYDLSDEAADASDGLVSKELREII